MLRDFLNAYLTVNCLDVIWTIAGPEFGSKTGMISSFVKVAPCGLKYAKAAFSSLLHTATLMDTGDKPTIADLDVWICPPTNLMGLSIMKWFSSVTTTAMTY